MRVGIGYDVHRLVEGRKLIIGGVEIENSKGLLGHSDADVLIHSICDALLGAAALGDIGVHFPDDDQAYKDISSLILLERVTSLLKSRRYEIINVDSTIVAELPKLSSFFIHMRENIAHSCGIEVSCVSVKATTNEEMGFLGSKEGMAAFSVAMIDGLEKDVKTM